MKNRRCQDPAVKTPALQGSPIQVLNSKLTKQRTLRNPQSQQSSYMLGPKNQWQDMERTRAAVHEQTETKNSNMMSNNVHTEHNNTNFVNQSMFTNKDSKDDNAQPVLEEVRPVSEIKMVTGASKEHISPLVSPKWAGRNYFDGHPHKMVNIVSKPNNTSSNDLSQDMKIIYAQPEKKSRRRNCFYDSMIDSPKFKSKLLNLRNNHLRKRGEHLQRKYQGMLEPNLQVFSNRNKDHELKSVEQHRLVKQSLQPSSQMQQYQSFLDSSDQVNSSMLTQPHLTFQRLTGVFTPGSQVTSPQTSQLPTEKRVAKSQNQGRRVMKKKVGKGGFLQIKQIKGQRNQPLSPANLTSTDSQQHMQNRNEIFQQLQYIEDNFSAEAASNRHSNSILNLSTQQGLPMKRPQQPSPFSILKNEDLPPNPLNQLTANNLTLQQQTSGENTDTATKEQATMRMPGMSRTSSQQQQLIDPKSMSIDNQRYGSSKIKAEDQLIGQSEFEDTHSNLRAVELRSQKTAEDKGLMVKTADIDEADQESDLKFKLLQVTDFKETQKKKPIPRRPAAHQLRMSKQKSQFQQNQPSIQFENDLASANLSSCPSQRKDPTNIVISGAFPLKNEQQSSEAVQMQQQQLEAALKQNQSLLEVLNRGITSMSQVPNLGLGFPMDSRTASLGTWTNLISSQLIQNPGKLLQASSQSPKQRVSTAAPGFTSKLKEEHDRLSPNRRSLEIEAKSRKNRNGGFMNPRRNPSTNESAMFKPVQTRVVHQSGGGAIYSPLSMARKANLSPKSGKNAMSKQSIHLRKWRRNHFASEVDPFEVHSVRNSMKIVDQEFSSPKSGGAPLRKSTDIKITGKKKPDSTGAMISLEGPEPLSRKKQKGYGIQSSIQSTIQSNRNALASKLSPKYSPKIKQGSSVFMKGKEHMNRLAQHRQAQTRQLKKRSGSKIYIQNQIEIPSPQLDDGPYRMSPSSQKNVSRCFPQFKMIGTNSKSRVADSSTSPLSNLLLSRAAATGSEKPMNYSQVLKNITSPSSLLGNNFNQTAPLDSKNFKCISPKNMNLNLGKRGAPSQVAVDRNPITKQNEKTSPVPKPRPKSRSSLLRTHSNVGKTEKFLRGLGPNSKQFKMHPDRRAAIESFIRRFQRVTRSKDFVQILQTSNSKGTESLQKGSLSNNIVILNDVPTGDFDLSKSLEQLQINGKSKNSSLASKGNNLDLELLSLGQGHHEIIEGDINLFEHGFIPSKQSTDGPNRDSVIFQEAMANQSQGTDHTLNQALPNKNKPSYQSNSQLSQKYLQPINLKPGESNKLAATASSLRGDNHQQALEQIKSEGRELELSQNLAETLEHQANNLAAPPLIILSADTPLKEYHNEEKISNLQIPETSFESQKKLKSSRNEEQIISNILRLQNEYTAEYQTNIIKAIKPASSKPSESRHSDHSSSSRKKLSHTTSNILDQRLFSKSQQMKKSKYVSQVDAVIDVKTSAKRKMNEDLSAVRNPRVLNLSASRKSKITQGSTRVYSRKKGAQQGTEMAASGKIDVINRLSQIPLPHNQVELELSEYSSKEQESPIKPSQSSKSLEEEGIGLASTDQNFSLNLDQTNTMSPMIIKTTSFSPTKEALATQTTQMRDPTGQLSELSRTMHQLFSSPQSVLDFQIDKLAAQIQQTASPDLAQIQNNLIVLDLENGMKISTFPVDQIPHQNLGENCLILRQFNSPIIDPSMLGQKAPRIIDFSTFHQEYQNWELLHNLSAVEKVQAKIKTFACPLPELEEEEDKEVKNITDPIKKNMKNMKSQGVLSKNQQVPNPKIFYQKGCHRPQTTASRHAFPNKAIKTRFYQQNKSQISSNPPPPQRRNHPGYTSMESKPLPKTYLQSSSSKPPNCLSQKKKSWIGSHEVTTPLPQESTYAHHQPSQQHSQNVTRQQIHRINDFRQQIPLQNSQHQLVLSSQKSPKREDGDDILLSQLSGQRLSPKEDPLASKIPITYSDNNLRQSSIKLYLNQGGDEAIPEREYQISLTKLQDTEPLGAETLTSQKPTAKKRPLPFKPRKFEKLNLSTLQENPYLKQKYHFEKFEKLQTQQDTFKVQQPSVNGANVVDTQRGFLNYQDSSKIDLNSIKNNIQDSSPTKILNGMNSTLRRTPDHSNKPNIKPAIQNFQNRQMINVHGSSISRQIDSAVVRKGEIDLREIDDDDVEATSPFQVGKPMADETSKGYSRVEMSPASEVQGGTSSLSR